MTRKAKFFVSIGGVDVSANFSEKTTDITVTDSSGESSDTASISIADDNSIKLPVKGDPVVIGLGWDAPVVIFEGTIDNVTSAGSRGQGKTLQISAKSADTVKGKAKQQMEKHEDKTTLGSVAQKWAGSAGLEVSIHSELASIERDYWSMNNESFISWGERTAKEIGATFKIMGTRAVMVPRGAGVSATGKALSAVVATWGDNLIDWNISPSVGRPEHKKVRTRHFDPDEAEWQQEDEDADYDTDAEAEMTTRYPEPDKATAKRRSRSKNKENKRDKGGGSVTIDGNPDAQSEAPLILVGARPGVDGTYRIDSVTHRFNRGGGYTNSISLKEPSGAAGKDDR